MLGAPPNFCECIWGKQVFLSLMHLAPRELYPLKETRATEQEFGARQGFLGCCCGGGGHFLFPVHSDWHLAGHLTGLLTSPLTGHELVGANLWYPHRVLQGAAPTGRQLFFMS